MNEKELFEIEAYYAHNKHVLQLVSEVRRLNEEVESWQGLAHDRLKNWCMFWDRSSQLEKENNRYQQFIRNGVALGYIFVPDRCDPAYQIIQKALKG